MLQSIKKQKRRVGALLAVFMVSLGILTPAFTPREANAAYHQVYIQATVDTNNWTIVAGAVDESTSYLGEPLENQRIGQATLKELRATETPADAAPLMDKDPSNDGGAETSNLVLSFPGDSNPFNNLTHYSSNTNDMARATLVRNSLIYELNDAFHFVYGDDYQPFGSNNQEKLDNYITTMESFLSAIGTNGTVNGFSTSVLTESAAGVYNIKRTSFPDETVAYSDYVVITSPSPESESRVFQYRMPKGYIRFAGEGRQFDKLSIIDSSVASSSTDAKFIHWGTLAVEGVINVQADDKIKVSTDNVYDGTPSSLEKAITSLLNSLVNGLVGGLGLWNFDELMFNSGTRGTRAYAAGVFPSSWQPYIWALFFVMEIVALCVLIFSIIYNVARKALATVNPVARANAIEQIKNLFIVAFVLGTLPVIIQLLMNVTQNMTGIFADALGDKTAQERFGSLAASGGLFSLLTYIVYLGAVIYFNIFYLVRSFSVAFLIIFAPIFIVAMAISETKKNLTIIWVKEMLANLFIQPLQAMALCFILLVPSSDRKIESLIIAYIMIPLTNMLRSLFFGDSGGIADQIANRGKQASNRVAQAVARTGTSVVGGAAAGAAGAGFAYYQGRQGQEGESRNNSEDNGSQGNNGNPSAGKKGTNPTQPSGQPQSPFGPDDKLKTDFDDDKSALPSDTKALPPPASGQNSSMNGSREADAAPLPGKEAEANDIGRQAAGASEMGAQQDSTDSAAQHGADMDAKGMDIGRRAAMISGVAGAVALGAVGGAMDGFNRRVFGINNGPRGGIVTQLSRKSASKLADMHKKEGQQDTTPAPQKPLERGFDPSAYRSAMEDTSENPYEQGLAEKKSFTAEDGLNGDAYTIRGGEDMRAAGIQSVEKGADNGTSEITYNAEALNLQDQERMAAMMEIWQQGGPEREALEAAGIMDVSPVQKKVGGQTVTTGASITVDNDKFQKTFGVSASRNQYSIDTAPGQAPAIVPDVGSYLGSSEASTSYAESKAFQQVGEAAAASGVQMEASDDYVTFTAPSHEQIATFNKATGSAFNSYEITETRQTDLDAVPMAQVKVPRAEFSKTFYHGEEPALPRSYVGEQVTQASPTAYTPPPVRKTPAAKPAPSRAEDDSATSPHERKRHNRNQM